MQEIIASYLVQKKVCSLPLLGSFRIKTKPSELDIANKQIFPPTDEILFNENAGNNLVPDLIEYVSILQHISLEEAEEKIAAWCYSAKQKLISGEKLFLDSIGSLQKNAVGNIFFQRNKAFNFYDPVFAERVIHENEQHSVLVGDKETTSGAMNEFYREEIIEKKSTWKIWALVFLIIGLLALIFHFYHYGFTASEIGNQSTFPVSALISTYSNS